MEKIEADVVISISLIAKNGNTIGMVIPFWECDLTSDQLLDRANQFALELAERNGTGIAEYQINDFRFIP